MGVFTKIKNSMGKKLCQMSKTMYSLTISLSFCQVILVFVAPCASTCTRFMAGDYVIGKTTCLSGKIGI